MKWERWWKENKNARRDESDGFCKLLYESFSEYLSEEGLSQVRGYFICRKKSRQTDVCIENTFA